MEATDMSALETSELELFLTTVRTCWESIERWLADKSLEGWLSLFQSGFTPLDAYRLGKIRKTFPVASSGNIHEVLKSLAELNATLFSAGADVRVMKDLQAAISQALRYQHSFLAAREERERIIPDLTANAPQGAEDRGRKGQSFHRSRHSDDLAASPTQGSSLAK